jgi:hypothetical protein
MPRLTENLDAATALPACPTEGTRTTRLENPQPRSCQLNGSPHRRGSSIHILVEVIHPIWQEQAFCPSLVPVTNQPVPIPGHGEPIYSQVPRIVPSNVLLTTATNVSRVPNASTAPRLEVYLEFVRFMLRQYYFNPADRNGYHTFKMRVKHAERASIENTAQVVADMADGLSTLSGRPPNVAQLMTLIEFLASRVEKPARELGVESEDLALMFYHFHIWRACLHLGSRACSLGNWKPKSKSMKTKYMRMLTEMGLSGAELQQNGGHNPGREAILHRLLLHWELVRKFFPEGSKKRRKLLEAIEQESVVRLSDHYLAPKPPSHWVHFVRRVSLLKPTALLVIWREKAQVKRGGEAAGVTSRRRRAREGANS